LLAKLAAWRAELLLLWAALRGTLTKRLLLLLLLLLLAWSERLACKEGGERIRTPTRNTKERLVTLLAKLPLAAKLALRLLLGVAWGKQARHAMLACCVSTENKSTKLHLILPEQTSAGPTGQRTGPAAG
jgi:hypothetical protein